MQGPPSGYGPPPQGYGQGYAPPQGYPPPQAPPPKDNTLKVAAIVLAVIVACAVLIPACGCIACGACAGIGASAGKSKPSGGGGKAPRAPAAANEAAITVDATTLMRDYKANEVGADVKWKGKLVRVTGIVGEIKKDVMDQPYVTLGTGAAVEIPEVQCTMADGQDAAVSGLRHGTKATLTGRVSGLLMNVLISDCRR
jgi:hypothetical protein